MEVNRCPQTGEWIKKTRDTHMTDRYPTLATKNALAFATTPLNLEAFTLSKRTQSQKDKYSMIPLTSAIRESRIHRSREQNGGCQAVWAGEN